MSAVSSTSTADSDKPFGIQYVNQIGTLLGSSIAFVAGLAVNEAITSTIERFYHHSEKILAKFIYATVMLLVASLILLLVTYLKNL